MKHKKSFSIIILFLVTLICTIYSPTLKNAKFIQKLPMQSDDGIFMEINALVENVTGDCNAGIYNLHAYENQSLEYFVNQSSYSKMWAPNATLQNFDYNLTLARMEIAMTGMTTPYTTYSVANDTSNPINGTVESKAYMLAQNFTMDEHSHVDFIYIYLNYTNWFPFIWAGIVYVDIYEEDLTTKVNKNNMTIFLPDSGGLGVWNYSWYHVQYNNYLAKGNYYLTIWTQSTSILRAPNNNSWQVQNYSNPNDEQLT
jgi:hypothetical protein